MYKELQYNTYCFSLERTFFDSLFCTLADETLISTILYSAQHTVPRVINFPSYNKKCSGENDIPRGIFRVVSRFPLHFVLYLGKFDYFLDSASQAVGHVIPPQVTEFVSCGAGG